MKKSTKTPNKNIEQLLALYKGINSKLYQSLDSQTQEFLVAKTIKELCLLAESANPSAGEKLYKLLNSLADKHLPLLEIESLLEFGKNYKDLSRKEKKEVEDMEIQQELSHFSRIMNLDGILTGLERNNLETAIDFSRFLELLAERREDRGETSLSSWARPSKALTFTATNSPICGIMQEEAEKNHVALLAADNEDKKLSPKDSLLQYGKLAHRFNIKTSSLLYDYLLSLEGVNSNIAFISTHSYVSDKTTKLEVSGGGGCGVLVLKPDPENLFKRKIVKRLTVGKTYSWDFGKTAQSLVEYMVLTFKDTSLKVFCFAPDVWNEIEKLSDKELHNILNKPQSNGWFNQTNAIIDYLKGRNLNSQIAVLTPNRVNQPKINKVKPSLTSAVKQLQHNDYLHQISQKDDVLIESAHLHADRKPGQEQWDCVLVTNQFEKILKKSGFKGTLGKIVMVDDYHVINRLDYTKFGSELKNRGLNFSKIILESSPLIRIIAIEILKYLAINHRKSQNYRIVKRGDNLYLEIPTKGLSIELVADMETNPMIGCVLFDVAFTIYKTNMDYYNQKYNHLFGIEENEDLHTKLIGFFNKNKNTDARVKEVEKYFVDIPKWEELQNEKVAPQFINKSTIVNVLEDFYRPQQKKVNNFLSILDQEQVYSLYYNLESNEISLEITGGTNEQD